jgi:hypothetical protein
MLASALLPHGRFTQVWAGWPHHLAKGTRREQRWHSGSIGTHLDEGRNTTKPEQNGLLGSTDLWLEKHIRGEFSCGFSDLSDITGQMVRRVVGAGAQAGTATIRHLGRLAHVGAVASIETAVGPITDSADAGSRH